MICDHWAMRLRVESTSGSKDGCGLLYLPMSAKAVTRQEPLLGFFTRKDGFRYSTVIPTSSGHWKTPSCSRWSNFSWWFYELVAGILGEAAFPLRGLDGAYVDLCLVRTCRSIVTWKLRVKYGVVLFEQR